MFCCKGSNAPSNNSGILSAALSKRGSRRDFRTRAISPAYFENSRVLLLRGSEQIRGQADDITMWSAKPSRSSRHRSELGLVRSLLLIGARWRQNHRLVSGFVSEHNGES